MEDDERNTWNYSNFGRISDDRIEHKAGREFSDYDKNLYDSLINMVVNHKMELQKIPQCSAITTAKEWAAKRKLRAGEQDLDGDKVKEVVVYNRAGQPMIINGYRPRKSDFATRQAYWSENPTSERRAEAGPYKEWLQEKAYKVRYPDEHNMWKRKISTTPWYEEMKEKGYRMPTAPKKKFSVFSIFSKLIAPYVKNYFENGALVLLLGEAAGPECATLLKKLISPISIYRMLYMKCVERYYYFHLRTGMENMDSYKKLKAYIKSNKNKFWTFFKSNLLAGDKLEKFKDNIINDEVIAQLMSKENLQWDMSDEDDALVFMIGKANVEDQEFMETITVQENAQAMLEQLKSGNKTDQRKAKKDLEKWKNRATAATKDFFEKKIKNLIENENAEAIFRSQIENEKNPIDPRPGNDDVAPASPTKSAESGTVKEEKMPGAAQDKPKQEPESEPDDDDDFTQ